DTLGGVVRHIIPSFRIAPEAIDQDVSLLRALGVTLRCGCPVSSGASLLEAGYTHVLYAIGAWAHRALPLQGGQAMDALTFLEAAKDKPETLSLGRHVLVIGGGNTAMDTARVAKRIAGVDTVTLLYRRTLREMPADAEEYALALADGIVCRTLLSPVSLKGNRLLCEQMQLGAPDADGRRSP
ncbi:MAG: FAD-dependent oxidoreductase, partial [Clostridia bacterium]